MRFCCFGKVEGFEGGGVSFLGKVKSLDRDSRGCVVVVTQCGVRMWWRKFGARNDCLKGAYGSSYLTRKMAERKKDSLVWHPGRSESRSRDQLRRLGVA